MASQTQGLEKITATRMYLQLVSVTSTKQISYIYPISTSDHSLYTRQIPRNRKFFVTLITAELTLRKNKQEAETNA
ncbi:hypothetical protein EUGRSUZ_F03528 [Eucalyptus grandis]|uniref:Uncharacterized protein n=2 Tax=Eucalyptus grandis TaxID=71139 RepID=A0ACC3KML4_EUCGR|nr:hypothetical protein EUGRSUZ_F03528 [Eucalyptus grandis]